MPRVLCRRTTDGRPSASAFWASTTTRRTPEELARRYGTRADVEHTPAARRGDRRKTDRDRAGANGRAVVVLEFGGVALHADDPAAWGYAEARPTEDLLGRYRA